ncbi:MAG: hypothetical protein WC593_13530 [Methanoregula sp.]
MIHDNPVPVFSGSYLDTGYIFGVSAFTCCHNCTRRNNCPKKVRKWKCTKKQSTCNSCTRWSERGCKKFRLDWSILNI